jgi:hypothetical protein
MISSHLDPAGPLSDELIAAARDSGAQRLIDMNEPVRVNLIRIIEGLDALPTRPDPADA